jgi:hypothetical protein
VAAVNDHPIVPEKNNDVSRPREPVLETKLQRSPSRRLMIGLDYRISESYEASSAPISNTPAMDNELGDSGCGHCPDSGR